jgi:hypothetical protein
MTILNNLKIRNIRNIRKCLEMNENEDTTLFKLWDATKAAFGGRFIPGNTYAKI